MNSTGNYTCGMTRSVFRWYLFPYNVSMVVIYILLITAAVVANILVCIAVSINPKLRQNTATYFIISLAVSDLATTFFSMPFDLESFTTFGRWNHDEFICNLWTTAYLITIPTSMWNLLILSIDRYRTLRNPWARFRETPFMTKKRAMSTLAILWVLSTIYALAPQMGWKYAKSSLIVRCSGNECIFNITPLYSILSSVFNFYVPMFAMCFVYYKIYQIARTQYICPAPALDLQSVDLSSPVKETKHEGTQILQRTDTNQENDANETGSCCFEIAVHMEENKTQPKRLSDISCNETSLSAEIQNVIRSTQTARSKERLQEDEMHEQHANMNEIICGRVIDKITEGEPNEQGNTQHDDKELKNENEPTNNDDVDTRERNISKMHEIREENRNEHLTNEHVDIKEEEIMEKIDTKEHKNEILRNEHVTEINEVKIQGQNQSTEELDENNTNEQLSPELFSRTSFTEEGNDEEWSGDVIDLAKETQSCGTSDKKPDVVLSMIEIITNCASDGGHEQNVIVGETDLKDENVKDEHCCSNNILVTDKHRDSLSEDECTTDVTPSPRVQNNATVDNTTLPSLDDTVATAATETYDHSGHSEVSYERPHAIINRKQLNKKGKGKSSSLNSLESTSTYQSTLPYSIYRIDYLSASRESLGHLNNVDFMSKRKKIFVKNKKAACTVSIIVSAFLICWFPRTTLSIVQNLCMGRCFTTLQQRHILLYARHATLLLGYISAAINPIVYSYRNTQFRRAYRDMARKLLPCLKRLVPRSA